MFTTEARNPNTMHIDKATTTEMLNMIQNENLTAVNAVGKEIDSIAKAVDSITEGIKNGGRLIYTGAGTSGRLGVLDAAECPPTFGVDKGLVIGIIAGGARCMAEAAEGEEDDGEAGIRVLKEINLTANDHVAGISASGNAAFIADGLNYAKSIGTTTIGITSNAGSRLDRESDISIVLQTGAEAVTGSTRMKAGTAQKLVLNMLSTCAMIKTGKVYENLMINLRPTNIKLKKRVISIVCEICGCTEETAVELLGKNDWSIRSAVDEFKGQNEQ